MAWVLIDRFRFHHRALLREKMSDFPPCRYACATLVLQGLSRDDIIVISSGRELKPCRGGNAWKRRLATAIVRTQGSGRVRHMRPQGGGRRNRHPTRHRKMRHATAVPREKLKSSAKVFAAAQTRFRRDRAMDLTMWSLVQARTVRFPSRCHNHQGILRTTRPATTHGPAPRALH
jgi:hypothetical protein